MNPSIKPPKLVPVVFLLACLAWFSVQPDQAVAKTFPAQTSRHWVAPLPGSVKLVKLYRGPATRFSAGHRGIDYLVREKQILRAPHMGVIAFANPVALIPAVSIQHPGGYRTTFEPACTALPIGSPVAAGQVFAKVCKPDLPIPVKNPTVKVVKEVVKALNPLSHCRPRLCLHFSLRLNGEYLSPQSLIGGLEPSRLVK